MKFGIADYGMNVWHGGLYSVEDRLLTLRELGYNGIERIEAVSASDAINKATLYRQLGMDFSTCRGPNVQAGIEWTCGLGKEYVWLTPGQVNREVDFDVYCRRANEMIRVCAKFGLKAALHNHMNQRIENQNELDKFMEKCPDAGLLLDTGHLSAAGGDVIGTVKKYFKNIVAVHLKDVELTGDRDENGRAVEWRFCELGTGNDGLDNAAVMHELVKRGYDGWVHIEHDAHQREPLDDLKVSLEFLRDAGFVKK
ncbi:MAG: sugar phosphate isomerase/epimerase [Victivallaceae bacterium]|nr:sugar phosphate isomerase/epimerase [Victivallaceae bacterium]MDD4181241.1 sugar phosphate isomerase/epimerase [Victivallaceae bacterium]